MSVCEIVGGPAAGPWQGWSCGGRSCGGVPTFPRSVFPRSGVPPACSADLSCFRGTCSDLLFCELAISDLSFRIGDSLAREAHESVQKITDAIHQVITGPRPTGFFSVLRPLDKTCQGGAKVVYKEDGMLTTTVAKRRLCLLRNLLVCWEVTPLSRSLLLHVSDSISTETSNLTASP